MMKVNGDRRLLILSCSLRKRIVEGKVATWDLYDGVAFRVLKRSKREGRFPGDVEVLILSARYGLIRPETEIGFYDQRMTVEVARCQARTNCAFLHGLLRTRCYREVFVMMGRTYLVALEPFEAWLPSNTRCVIAPGGLGQKLSVMKAWLSGLSGAGFKRP